MYLFSYRGQSNPSSSHSEFFSGRPEGKHSSGSWVHWVGYGVMILDLLAFMLLVFGVILVAYFKSFF